MKARAPTWVTGRNRLDPRRPERDRPSLTSKLGGAIALLVAASAVRAQPGIRIGGFDASRGGDLSIESGSEIGGLRATVLNEFPDAAFSGSSELTDDYLGGIDVLVISAVFSASRVPIDALSLDEQAALRSFVEAGGTAMLFADNSDFAPAAQSLVEPFGITVGNYFGGYYEAIVFDPGAHEATSGPFGVVNLMQVAICGEFVALGPYADGLASFEAGSESHLVAGVVEFGLIGPDSGLVLALADTSMLFDALRSQDTTELVLNAIFAAQNHGCLADINDDGVVDTRDVLQYLGAWVLHDPSADWNHDGTINTLDFLAFLNDWSAGC